MSHVPPSAQFLLRQPHHRVRRPHWRPGGVELRRGKRSEGTGRVTGGLEKWCGILTPPAAALLPHLPLRLDSSPSAQRLFLQLGPRSKPRVRKLLRQHQRLRRLRRTTAEVEESGGVTLRVNGSGILPSMPQLQPRTSQNLRPYHRQVFPLHRRLFLHYQLRKPNHLLQPFRVTSRQLLGHRQQPTGRREGTPATERTELSLPLLSRISYPVPAPELKALWRNRQRKGAT